MKTSNKILLITFLAILAVILLGSGSLIHYVSSLQSGKTTEKMEKIIIDRQTTPEDLDSIQKTWAKRDVKLDIQETRFNDKGELEAIQGEVETPAESSGSFKTDSVTRIEIEPGLFKMRIDMDGQ